LFLFSWIAIENSWMIKVYHIMKMYKHIFFKVNLYAHLSQSIDSQTSEQVQVAAKLNYKEKKPLFFMNYLTMNHLQD
jgi:hypothetical protein